MVTIGHAEVESTVNPVADVLPPTLKVGNLPAQATSGLEKLIAKTNKQFANRIVRFSLITKP
jgi:hypothetical protein